jgi:hypothetical protein
MTHSSPSSHMPTVLELTRHVGEHGAICGSSSLNTLTEKTIKLNFKRNVSTPRAGIARVVRGLDYGLENTGIAVRSPGQADISLLSETSRPVLAPTHPLLSNEYQEMFLQGYSGRGEQSTLRMGEVTPLLHHTPICCEYGQWCKGM